MDVFNWNLERIFFFNVISVNDVLLIVVKEQIYSSHGRYYYRPPEGGRLYDMKVVSGYAFLRTYYV